VRLWGGVAGAFAALKRMASALSASMEDPEFKSKLTWREMPRFEDQYVFFPAQMFRHKVVREHTSLARFLI
jgi:hypothetical protein